MYKKEKKEAVAQANKIRKKFTHINLNNLAVNLNYLSINSTSWKVWMHLELQDLWLFAKGLLEPRRKLL